jgi:hypothetical protein
MNQRQSTLKDRERNGKWYGYRAIAVPSDARAFERWFFEKRSEWPEAIEGLGWRALLSLKAEGTDSAVMFNLNRRDLQAFVEAYEAFRTDSV